MTLSTPARADGGPPRTDGRFLQVAGRRFLVKGVSYGTFAPGAGGGQFPAQARLVQDFAAIAAAGFNTVRTYTEPPEAVLDAAADLGLRLIVGLPWPQHVAFLDDRGLARQIRRDARATVRRLATHPAALLFAAGNEIPAGIVRWHGPRRIERFLTDLSRDIKDAAPAALLTYVNFPPTEYLDPDGFDVCAFNVYLHHEADLRAYLARLQHVAGARPLLLAEAGADSVREGLDGQARLTAMQVRAAFAEGACGAVAFSWTDEWWRGGHAVEDWAFGLVDAERRPKPALAAVSRAFADAPFPPDERARWPMVSVVVCARDAADTIDDCLASLAALTYPSVEILLVNDGSRDRTADLARRHPGVRVIDVPHGGLSAARNAGLSEARGEIVAYTDADCRVDPDWLTWLVQPLVTGDVVGTGGPNIVPDDDPWVAQCVARAPGGPTHVLLDDRTAEHVPGCNMAFRRGALLAIDGFNPVYVRAGDDVDVCWRLQARGWRIGFAPAALVWHHHRGTVGAFWNQQVGYGEAEAWLHEQHPEQFAAGETRWRGRIYSPLPFVRSLRGRRVNTGTWGTAAFPSIYSTRAHPLQLLPHAPAWALASTALVLASVLGLPGSVTGDPVTGARGAAWLLAAGLLGWMTTVARCGLFAWRTSLDGLRPIGRFSPDVSRVVYRLVIAWLHLIQPLARMRGRIRGMWSQPHAGGAGAPDDRLSHRPAESPMPTVRDVPASGRLLAGGTGTRSFWSESWVAHSALLTDLVEAVRTAHPALAVELDEGWHADRDVSLAVGRWGRLQIRVVVEEHAQGRCLVRTAARLRPSDAGAVLGVLLAAVLAAGAGAAAAGVGAWAGVLTAAAAAGVLARVAWQTLRASSLFTEALTRVTGQAGMLPLPVRPEMPERLRQVLRPAVAALALVVAVGLGAGGVADRRAPATVTPGADRVLSDIATGGGVAVGLAGDLFVADTQEGLIRRLRPRPPFDAPWTADDIGSDGDPVLGQAVAFEAAADIAVAPNGDIYIADARHHRVWRAVRSTGQTIVIAGTGTSGFAGDGGPAASALLDSPSAIAVAPNGDVFVADTRNDRIRVIASATSRIATFAGDGRPASGTGVGDDGPARQAQLRHPVGVAVAANGDVYVADTGHHRVRRIGAGTGIITTIAGDGQAGSTGDGGPAVRARLSAPAGLALGSSPRGPVVYVADVLNNRVRAIGPGGDIAELDGPGALVHPTRVAYHPAGWLYVKDAGPDGVTAIATSAQTRLALAADTTGSGAGRESRAGGR